jgi:amino acid transporter
LSILDVVLGRRLANRESEQRKIGAFEGVAAMGLDGLGSSAYGPEAALTILIPLGAAGLAYIGWITAAILALLAILYASYWQTIRAYPNNGGGYIVTKDNLGTNASLLAAAALMTDYVLNVSVGISAGVGALVSAIPVLHPWILPMCLGILLLVTIVNLRGTQDAGRLLAIPTYLFVACFTAVLAIGITKALLAGGHPSPVLPPPALPKTTEAVSLWLLARAFASGCTAMTGVEAVSNGMSAFREPPLTHGHRTLSAIVIILGILLAGIAYLASAYRIGAMDQTQDGYRSVLSQLVSAIAGNGAFYYVAIGSVLLVLCLSANTSFVDFPRLCRMVAEDGFLPKSFSVAGRRLVFTAGMLYLAGCSGLLLLAFGGITDRLIPLFAIGAFLTFTLSQAGMAIHWRRELRNAAGRREANVHRMHLWINALGSIATGTALVVIIAAKFLDGAWITIFVIPAVIILLKTVRRYYDELGARLGFGEPLSLKSGAPPIMLVALHEWSKPAARALRLALALSPDVVAFHLSHLNGPEAEENERELRAQWQVDVEEPTKQAGMPPPRLLVLPAEYRTIEEPVLRLVKDLRSRLNRETVVVLIPELVKQRWYQHILHMSRANRLRTQLMNKGKDLTVVTVPWRLEQ